MYWYYVALTYLPRLRLDLKGVAVADYSSTNDSSRIRWTSNPLPTPADRPVHCHPPADQKRYSAEYRTAVCAPSVHDPDGARPPWVRSRCT
jgi:hypothetical protein